jgi:hypothetical protein
MLPFIAFGQSPQQMNYQGVARDSGGNVLANQAIGLQAEKLGIFVTNSALTLPREFNTQPKTERGYLLMLLTF